MKYFEHSDLSSENLALLEEYDAFIHEKVGLDYPYPIRMRDWELFETLKQLAPRSGHCTVLDTGSFNTYLGIWLSEIADEVVVSDLLIRRLWISLLRRVRIYPVKRTEAAFERWFSSVKRASPKIRLRNVDLIRIPFLDGHFDYVTSISVIEHIPDVEVTIREMYRCLKPGGRLLLTTDCSPHGKPFSNGVRYFTADELEEMFAKYPIVSEHRAPDFRRENWCYHADQPLLTAFVAIEKPCASRGEAGCSI